MNAHQAQNDMYEEKRCYGITAIQGYAPLIPQSLSVRCGESPLCRGYITPRFELRPEKVLCLDDLRDGWRDHRLPSRIISLDAGQNVRRVNGQVRFLVRSNRLDTADLEQQFGQMVPRRRRCGVLQGMNLARDRITGWIDIHFHRSFEQPAHRLQDAA